MRTSNLLVLAVVVWLLSACKGKTSYEPINNNDATSASTSTDSTEVDTDQPKLVKTAEMSMKVKDIHKSTEAIVSLTESYKGMVMRHHMQSAIERSHDVPRNDDSVMRVSSFTTSADITVKCRLIAWCTL